jgi:CubicO group peptidase (beta-lactamase class C family)
VRYVPAFAAHGKQDVTLLHLLCHQGALALPEAQVAPEAWWDWDSAVAAACALEPFAPAGTTAAYTVLAGHQVLGEVVRVATGQAFADAVQDLVLRPLGMTRTSWGRPTGDDDVSDVVGVDPERQAVCDRWGSPEALAAVLPSIGLHSCARDVARLLESWLSDVAPTQPLLAPATLRAARALQVPLTERTGFGLGWLVGGDPATPGSRGALAGPRSFGHPGMCSSQAWADPDTGVVLVAVANTDCGQDESDRRFALLGDAVCRATS